MNKMLKWLIALVAVAAVLAAAFWYGGDSPDSRGWEVSPTTPSQSATPTVTPTAAPSHTPTPETATPVPSATPTAETVETPAVPETTPVAPETTAEPDAAPTENPAPVEPEQVVIGETAYTCTLTVRCDILLDNLELLPEEKWELVPEDGVIFPETTVTFYEGESVFNVLQREMKKAKIHMEFNMTPIYNSAYIEGIANFYEFECGELSGWVYKVNGWGPNYGCSRYALKGDDRVEVLYTCDRGGDVGAGGGFWAPDETEESGGGNIRGQKAP